MESAHVKTVAGCVEVTAVDAVTSDVSAVSDTGVCLVVAALSLLFGAHEAAMSVMASTIGPRTFTRSDCPDRSLMSRDAWRKVAPPRARQAPPYQGTMRSWQAEDWQHRYEDSVAREDARMASNLDELG